LEHLANVYPDHFQKIVQELQHIRHLTFRINSLCQNSISAKELLELGYDVKNTEYFKSFFLNSLPEKSISHDDAVQAGQIYIQGLSSMIPAYELDPKPGENIMDLCAAPGSKTSLLADISHNKANITAADNNFGRLNATKANLQALNVQNVTFIKSDASVLSRNPEYINRFDKVLADVPCSNEGLIRDLDNYDFTYWNPKLAKHLPNLQKRILASGIQMLKPGGTLVYSTCTYSPEENEEVADWALRKFPDIALAELNFSAPNTTPGLTAWKNKELNPTLSKTLRVLPNELFDGFYVAKFVKRA